MEAVFQHTCISQHTLFRFGAGVPGWREQWEATCPGTGFQTLGVLRPHSGPAWPGLATVNELPLPWPHCCAPPAPSSPPCAVWPPVMRFLSVTYKLPSMGGLLCFFAGFGKTSNTRKECLRETRLSPEHLLSYEPVTFYKPFKCS